MGSGINSPPLTGLPTLFGGVTGAGVGARDFNAGGAVEPITGVGLGATGVGLDCTGDISPIFFSISSNAPPTGAGLSGARSPGNFTGLPAPIGELDFCGLSPIPRLYPDVPIVSVTGAGVGLGATRSLAAASAALRSASAFAFLSAASFAAFSAALRSSATLAFLAASIAALRSASAFAFLAAASAAAFFCCFPSCFSFFLKPIRSSTRWCNWCRGRLVIGLGVGVTGCGLGVTGGGGVTLNSGGSTDSGILLTIGLPIRSYFKGGGVKVGLGATGAGLGATGAGAGIRTGGATLTGAGNPPNPKSTKISSIGYLTGVEKTTYPREIKVYWAEVTYHYVTSSKLATTCNLLAVAAVTFNISDSSTTIGAVSSSTVALAPTALTLNTLNTAEAASVSVTVIVSALPESSDTSIDLTIAVFAVGHVYSVVALVVVKSTFAFLY